MTRKSIKKGLRFEILNRDNFTCRYCGAKAPDVSLEVDHVVPVSRGGKNNKENLVTSCWGCNIGKGAKVLTRPQRSNRRCDVVAMVRSLAGVIEAKYGSIPRKFIEDIITQSYVIGFGSVYESGYKIGEFDNVLSWVSEAKTLDDFLLKYHTKLLENAYPTEE